MRTAPWIVLFVGWFAACGVGVTAAWNWMTGGSTPLGNGAVSGFSGGVGTLCFLWLRAKGWTFFGARAALEERRAQLARDRDRAINEARSRTG